MTEFKIALLKMKQDTRKLRQFNELGNKINEQKEYCTKKIKNQKKKLNRNSGAEDSNKRDEEQASEYMKQN